MSRNLLVPPASLSIEAPRLLLPPPLRVPLRVPIPPPRYLMPRRAHGISHRPARSKQVLPCYELGLGGAEAVRERVAAVGLGGFGVGGVVCGALVGFWGLG